jgi:hypothetical protein
MPESPTRVRAGLRLLGPLTETGHDRMDTTREIDEPRLSQQDLVLLQACLQFVLKHQQDPGVSARLKQLADTLVRLKETT